MTTNFVKTDAHPLLATMTGVFSKLESAVAAAEEASRSCRQARSELFTPVDNDDGVKRKKKGGKTAMQLATERKLHYVSASLRERAAFDPLCDAMDAMYGTLATVAADKRGAHEDDAFLGWMADAVSINVIASIELYRRAIRAIDKMDLIGYEWTLGCCADQESERQLGWLDTVPALPARQHENPYWTHVGAHVMGRILQHIEGLRKGGGGGCIALDRERHEERAAYEVAGMLRDKGWKVDMQDHPALCVQVPAEAEEE